MTKVLINYLAKYTLVFFEGSLQSCISDQIDNWDENVWGKGFTQRFHLRLSWSSRHKCWGHPVLLACITLYSWWRLQQSCVDDKPVKKRHSSPVQHDVGQWTADDLWSQDVILRDISDDAQLRTARDITKGLSSVCLISEFGDKRE